MDVSSALDAGLTALSTVSSVMGGGAVLAAVLPKASDDAIKIYKIIRFIVDFVGANWINAKNDTSQ